MEKKWNHDGCNKTTNVDCPKNNGRGVTEILFTSLSVYMSTSIKEIHIFLVLKLVITFWY